MIKVILHALGRTLITFVFGVPSVPQITDEQCIVVANHNTHLDIMVLFRLFSLGRVNNVRTVAAEDYFGRGLKGKFACYLFNIILVERQPAGRDDPLRPVTKALEAGYSIIVFPEGTRGEPGIIEHFKSGVGKLALTFPQLPVYPAILLGAEKTLPKNKYIPVPFSISLELLDPLYGKNYDMEHPSVARKELTAVLERKIRQALALPEE